MCCTLTGLYSSAYKLSAYALQWLLSDIALDSIIDVLGYTFDASLSDASYFTLRGAPVTTLQIPEKPLHDFQSIDIKK